eukprot:scaffold56832_cov45-Attheya_sp.AAC.3
MSPTIRVVKIYCNSLPFHMRIWGSGRGTVSVPFLLPSNCPVEKLKDQTIAEEVKMYCQHMSEAPARSSRQLASK